NWWNKASLTEIRGRIVAVRPRLVYRRSLPHTIRRRDRSQNRNSRPAKILRHRTVPSQQPSSHAPSRQTATSYKNYVSRDGFYPQERYNKITPYDRFRFFFGRRPIKMRNQLEIHRFFI